MALYSFALYPMQQSITSDREQKRDGSDRLLESSDVCYSLLKRPETMDDSDEDAASEIDTDLLLTNQFTKEEREERQSQTELHQACKGGRAAIERVHSCIKSGINVNARTKSGNTALHLAAEAGQEIIVIALLAANAWICIQNRAGTLPRTLALKNGHRTIAERLYSAGEVEKKQIADFREAIKKGDSVTVTKFLEMKVNLEEKESALSYAAQFGNCRIIELLFGAGAEVNGFDSDGCTPLHNAVIYGHKDLIPLLIERGAFINTENFAHETPLHLAACQGQMDVMKLLLKNGASQRGTTICNSCKYNGYNRTPISLAVSIGDYELIALLWSRGVSINCQKGDSSNSPLHWATLGTDSRMVSFLLACDAHINSRNSSGYTPLHLAAQNDDVVNLQLLLKAGADAQAQSTTGLTPVHIAVSKRSLKALNLLILAGASTDVPSHDGATPFSAAVANNNFGLARFLHVYDREKSKYDLTKKRNIEELILHIKKLMGSINHPELLYKNYLGLTTERIQLLYQIIEDDGDLEKVKIIVKDPSVFREKELFANGPLIIAVRNERVEIVRYLLAGISLMQLTDDEMLALVRAAVFTGNAGIMELLLAAKIKVNIKDKITEETPLHWVARKNSADLVKLLLNAQLSVNTVNQKQETALHIAARKGHADTIRVLIAAGADMNLLNKDRQTALYLACEEVQDAAIHVLIKAGCSISMPNTQNAFATRLMARHAFPTNGCIDTLKLFIARGGKIQGAIFKKDSVACVMRTVLILQSLGKKIIKK